jgi:hypothetical protein
MLRNLYALWRMLLRVLGVVVCCDASARTNRNTAAGPDRQTRPCHPVWFGTHARAWTPRLQLRPILGPGTACFFGPLLTPYPVHGPRVPSLVPPRATLRVPLLRPDGPSEARRDHAAEEGLLVQDGEA